MVLDKIFKNSEGEFISIFDVLLGKNDLQNYIYTLAEAHAIDLIAKINILDLIKLTIFCTAKETTKKTL